MVGFSFWAEEAYCRSTRRRAAVVVEHGVTHEHAEWTGTVTNVWRDGSAMLVT